MSPLLDQIIWLIGQAELAKLNNFSSLYAVNLININQFNQRTNRQRKLQNVV